MDEQNHDSTTNNSRRNFIRHAGIGAVSLTGLTAFTLPGNEPARLKAGVDEFFSTGNVTLFQGDSITDAGRDKKNESPNLARSFGAGYAFIIASRMLNKMPDKELSFYNRGISGDKVFQLAERWDKDCISLKPDVLSILIGVNDYWHLRQGRYDGTPEIYEADYRKLLTRTMTELPGIRLVICEPFALAGTSDVDESWLEPFSKYQESAARLCKEFSAIWVPFQTAFDKASETVPASYWLPDGVHPSMQGCQLMARTWLDAVRK